VAAGVGGVALLAAAVIGIALANAAPSLTGPSGAAPSAVEAPDASAAPGGSEDASAVPGGPTDGALPVIPGTPEVEPPGEPTAGPAEDPASELPPASDGDDSPAEGLPVSPALRSLISGPAPATATAEGALVDGFPDGIPIATRSSVATSDVSVEKQRVRASLTATTPEAGAAVLAEYDTAFAAFGFTPSDTPAGGGSTARAYGRGAESVTVTVTPTATGGSGYTVLALLVAAE